MIFDKLLVASVPGTFAVGMAVTAAMIAAGEHSEVHTMVGHVVLATQLTAAAVLGWRKLSEIDRTVKNGNGKDHQEPRPQPDPKE